MSPVVTNLTHTTSPSAKSNADNRVKKEKEKVKELQLEVDALRTQNEVLKSIVETSCTNEVVDYSEL